MTDDTNDERSAAKTLNALGFQTFRFAPTTDFDTPHDWVLMNINRTTQVQLRLALGAECTNCDGTPAYEPRTHTNIVTAVTCLYCLDPHGEFTFLATAHNPEEN